MNKEALEAAMVVRYAKGSTEDIIRAYLDKAVPSDVKEIVDQLRALRIILNPRDRESADLIEAQAAKIAELEEDLSVERAARRSENDARKMYLERAEKAEAALADKDEELAAAKCLLDAALSEEGGE